MNAYIYIVREENGFGGKLNRVSKMCGKGKNHLIDYEDF